jgi:uncharacterized protein (TIGR02118 family)
MTKLIFVLYKRQDMSADEFRSYWKDTHAPMSAKLPNVKGYIQNHALSDPEGEEPPYSGVAEVKFDSPEEMQSALESEEAQAAIADLPNFTDEEKIEVAVVEEVSVV